MGRNDQVCRLLHDLERNQGMCIYLKPTFKRLIPVLLEHNISKVILDKVSSFTCEIVCQKLNAVLPRARTKNRFSWCRVSTPCTKAGRRVQPYHVRLLPVLPSTFHIHFCSSLRMHENLSPIKRKFDNDSDSPQSARKSRPHSKVMFSVHEGKGDYIVLLDFVVF